MEDHKRMICKLEPLDSDGLKVAEFTKGVSYDFYKTEEDEWETKDDNGGKEVFFDTGRIFRELD